MGFFTDAYDLFCISAVAKLIGRIYYYDASTKKPGTLPDHVNNAITGVALCGTLAGQLFFGWLGDKLGRKKVYGITLVAMVGCAFLSGFSLGTSKESVVASLCFFRFWLGFGIGGDYPLSAVIMSEYANRKTRGGFIAAVFAMQGIGILVAGVFSMLVAKIFLISFPAPKFGEDPVLSTQPQGDYVWRIILMFGAIPAMLTYYWRSKMPETARFTALVAGNHQKAVEDMGKVLDSNFTLTSQTPGVDSSNSYGFFSKEFLRNHGLHLVGTSVTWFLLDIAFYWQNLTQKDIYPATGLLPGATKMNAIEEVFMISKVMFLVALVATVPGYWFTVFFIDKIGRFPIQLGGFFFMSLFMALIGFRYTNLRGYKCETSPTGFCGGNTTLFIVLYALTFFFANFGPNSTTFIVPAELFPARFRSTCHGISAAAGKAGAIFAVFVVQTYALHGDESLIKKVMIGLAIVNLMGFLFTFLVPETRGRSLEEISGETEAIGDHKATTMV
ncbi:low affinity inorganic phosphate transporter 8-like [Aristolochia californica]|uniref:low affinity inorganic phosphate transporter 8-like n=1 Tax=Aristolochia californica TaxID=171875 RepID=UPI0035D593A9